LEEIRAYGTSSIKLLVRDVDSLRGCQQKGSHDLMWITAYTAPHRFAAVFDQRILVMLDEFQNLAQYVYRDEKCAHRDHPRQLSFCRGFQDRADVGHRLDWRLAYKYKRSIFAKLRPLPMAYYPISYI
jgi:hypothetical protein